MRSSSSDPQRASFDWRPEPETQSIVRDVVDELFRRCPAAAELAERMHRETATRFVDWLDFIEIPRGDPRAARLIEAGYASAGRWLRGELYESRAGLFPLLAISEDGEIRVGIKAEDVSDLLTALGITDDTPIEGEPQAPLRRAPVYRGDGIGLWAVERHGTRGFDVAPFDAETARRVVRQSEALRRRRRDWPDDASGWEHVEALVEQAVHDLGPSRAADVFFAAEREYWQRRNRAARIQRARQDLLGLAWANHDHHTYRSSRSAFKRLIALLERLGFDCRERFYAGAEAGWGAQVLEHPDCRIVIFADVDLSPGEVDGDFGHEPLPERDHLGTVGLWVGLHGESILQAGLHHLECQFDHDALSEQLLAAGIETMPPFTNLPYLKQAFTFGERWRVAESRLAHLVEQRLLTKSQANQFLMHGAVGSHLENLQREDGYKGFNQEGVSEIIQRTDPRRVNDGLLGA